MIRTRILLSATLTQRLSADTVPKFVGSCCLNLFIFHLFNDAHSKSRPVALSSNDNMLMNN
jgi:hypothetical protein